MVLVESITQREYDKFDETTGGETAIRVVVAGGLGGVVIDDIRYVASSASFTGTADGSFDKPFATIQDAIDDFGVATTQADFEANKFIDILDGQVYTEDLTFVTRKYNLNINSATLTGDILMEIDNAERNGSTQFPKLSLLGSQIFNSGRHNGDTLIALKSGGTAVNIVEYKAYNMLLEMSSATLSQFVIADGTNGGSSVTTSLGLATFNNTTLNNGSILARETVTSFVNSSYSSDDIIECGYIAQARNNSNIEALTIEEYRTTTVSKDFIGLTLNDAGGVTWDAQLGARTWICDTKAATEILTKITSYPTITPTLITDTAEAVAYDNTISGLTADDVQAAIDEVAAALHNPPITESSAATITVSATDVYISSTRSTTGTGDVDLPAITATSKPVRVKDSGINAGTNTQTINPDGSDTIDGLTSYDFTNDGQSQLFVPNNSTGDWEVNG